MKTVFCSPVGQGVWKEVNSAGEPAMVRNGRLLNPSYPLKKAGWVIIDNSSAVIRKPVRAFY